MLKQTVWIGCVALAALSAAPARAAAVINFDALATLDTLNTQYGADGVVFGPEPDRWNVIAPGSDVYPSPSPPNVAAVIYDPVGVGAPPPPEIDFTRPAAGVSAEFITGGTEVMVTALDAGGAVLDARVVKSPPYASVLYEVRQPGHRVARLLVEGFTGQWGLDNLTVEDGDAPVTAARVDGTAGASNWYRSAVRVTLTTADPNGDAIAAIHYSVDGGPDVAAPGPEVTFDVATEGEHTVSYHAVDVCGETEAEHVLPLKLDWTAPAVHVNSPTPTSYPLGTSITVDASASDAVSGTAASQLLLDGAPVAAGQVLSGLAAGPHTFTIDATDVAGNAATQRVDFGVVAPPQQVEVRGGGLGRVDRRPVIIHLWARQSADGTAAGHLFFFDFAAGVRVTCRRIVSVQRTDSGAVVTGDGAVGLATGSARASSVRVTLTGRPGRPPVFIIELPGAPPLRGQLAHGSFVVK